jgi:hypothetical protein
MRTYFQEISTVEDLFPGDQRRRGLISRGSAQKRIASQGIGAEEDCFTGDLRRRGLLHRGSAQKRIASWDQRRRGFISRGLAQNGGLREEMESGIFRVSVQKRGWISRRLAQKISQGVDSGGLQGD